MGKEENLHEMRHRLFLELNKDVHKEEKKDEPKEETKVYKESSQSSDPMDHSRPQKMEELASNPPQDDHGAVSSQGVNIEVEKEDSHFRKRKLTENIRDYNLKIEKLGCLLDKKNFEDKVNMTVELSKKILNYILSVDLNKMTCQKLENILARISGDLFMREQSKGSTINCVLTEFRKRAGQIKQKLRSESHIDTGVRVRIIKILEK